MSVPVGPTAVQIAATDTTNSIVSMLLNRYQSLVGQINYLENAAANIASMQAEQTAIQNQLTALGYSGPLPS